MATYDVTAYGTLGDGSAIQDALDTISDDGYRLYIPAADWALPEITVPDGKAITFFGDGRFASKIVPETLTQNGFIVGTAQVTFQDIGFFSESQQTAGAYIRLGQAPARNFYSTIERCHFYKGYDAIAMENALFAHVVNNDFRTYANAGITISSPWTEDGGDHDISGNTFTNATDDWTDFLTFGTGIKIKSGGGTRIQNNKIVGGAKGVHVAGDFTGGSSVYLIEGNSIEGLTDAIVVEINNSTGYILRLQIVGNQLGSRNGRVIWVKGSGSRKWVKSSLIASNTLVNFGMAGIENGIDVDGMEYFVIANNVALKNQVLAGSVGYFTKSNCNKGLLAHNRADEYALSGSLGGTNMQAV